MKRGRQSRSDRKPLSTCRDNNSTECTKGLDPAATGWSSDLFSSCCCCHEANTCTQMAKAEAKLILHRLPFLPSQLNSPRVKERFEQQTKPPLPAHFIFAWLYIWSFFEGEGGGGGDTVRSTSIRLFCGLSLDEGEEGKLATAPLFSCNIIHLQLSFLPSPPFVITLGHDIA